MLILEVPRPCVKLFANDNLCLLGELDHKDVRSHVFIEPTAADAQVRGGFTDAKPSRVCHLAAHESGARCRNVALPEVVVHRSGIEMPELLRSDFSGAGEAVAPFHHLRDATLGVGMSEAVESVRPAEDAVAELAKGLG